MRSITRGSGDIEASSRLALTSQRSLRVTESINEESMRSIKPNVSRERERERETFLVSRRLHGSEGLVAR